MLVIGLTGGISTGKSSVSRLLTSPPHLLPLIDADLLARQVVQPGTPALLAIQRTFGTSIILPDGSLDRKKLGSIVFNDEEKRKKLNGIVHPAVRKAMFWAIVGCWVRGERVCVVDVPLLIESGLWRFVAMTVVVYCPQDIQLQRLMQRDNSTESDASSRLNSQLPISEKVEHADYIIDNSGSLEDLRAQVDTFIRHLDGRISWTWRLKWLFPPYGLFSGLWTMAWRNLFPSHRREDTKRV